MTKAKDCMSIRLFAISVPLVEETAGKASSKKSWNESTLPTSTRYAMQHGCPNSLFPIFGLL